MINEIKMEVWRPKVLLLGPGGVKGFLLLGSLLFFEKVKFLKDIKKIVGISVGSMAGLLYIIGCSITEILEFAIVTNIIDISTIDVINIMKKNGLISHDAIRKRLRDKVTEKYGFVPTLKQLYLMTGYEFEIVVTNLDKDTTEYFNHQTEPDLCCVEAVLMSITIPLIFQSYVYKNNIYLDGAISQAFPIQKYKDENVFAIMLKGARSDPKESFFSYLYHIIKLLTSITEKNLDVPPNTKILHLNYQIDDTIGVKLTFDKKVEMFMFGYYKAHEFYKKLNKQSSLHFPIDYQKLGSKLMFSSFKFSKSALKNNKIEDNTIVGGIYVQNNLPGKKEISYLDHIVEEVGDEYLMDLFEDSETTDFSITDNDSDESSSDYEFNRFKNSDDHNFNLKSSDEEEQEEQEQLEQEQLEQEQLEQEQLEQEQHNELESNIQSLDELKDELALEQGREQAKEQINFEKPNEEPNLQIAESLEPDRIHERKSDHDPGQAEEQAQGQAQGQEQGQAQGQEQGQELKQKGFISNENLSKETIPNLELHDPNELLITSDSENNQSLLMNAKDENRRHSYNPPHRKKKKKHKTPDWIGRRF